MPELIRLAESCYGELGRPLDVKVEESNFEAIAKVSSGRIDLLVVRLVGPATAARLALAFALRALSGRGEWQP